MIFFDVSHLLAIDFYKKRGFSASEIKELSLQRGTLEYVEKMGQQIIKMEAAIADMQKTLYRLQETKAFCKEAMEHSWEFTIREFPLYQVQETMDTVSSLGEYKEKVIQYLEPESEDILSNMVRIVAFDEKGYTGSQMCIVRDAEKETRAEGVFLEHGKCVHVILEADNDDNSIMQEMYAKSYEWVTERQIAFCGVAYIFIRFITFGVVALITYRKRNIYISMVFHCLCNILTTANFLVAWYV